MFSTLRLINAYLKINDSAFYQQHIRYLNIRGVASAEPT
jgi:hypothetical protein